KFRIGFSQCTFGDAWRKTMQKEMERELSFHPEIELIVKDANLSSEKQKEQIEELITEKIDLVNIFRRPDYLVSHAKEILLMNPLPKYVWFQLGIYNDEAAKMLEEKGIQVIQNRCIMVEHANL
ncbi:MAG: CoA-binding protein, partial [Ignavibacteria bacterium]